MHTGQVGLLQSPWQHGPDCIEGQGGGEHGVGCSKLPVFSPLLRSRIHVHTMTRAGGQATCEGSLKSA